MAKEICTLEQANRFTSLVIEAYRRDTMFDTNAGQLRDAINAELRPATDEVEAWRRAVERPLGCDDDESHTPEWAEDVLIERCQELADLESQLASVTGERDLAAFDKETAHRERDEALAKLAKAEREASAVVCALDDAGVPGVVGVDGPVLDCVDRPAVVVGETGGSPGRVKWLANQLEFYRKSTEHAEKLIEQLREQLAARPEPVVVDEALAERVLLELEQGQAHPGDLSRGYIQVALAALRRHIGAGASVSVPPGDSHEAVIVCKWGYALTAKGQVIIWSGDESRLNKDDLQKVVDAVTDYDQLRAEIEKTRAELEAYRATIRTLASEVVDLSEQHDALRAELEAARKTVHEIAIHLGCVDWSDGGRFVQAPDDRIIAAAGEAAGWQSSYGMYKELSERHDALRAACTLTGEEQDMLLDDEPRRVLEQLGARIEAALLKTAPAQYHPNDIDDVDGDVSQLGEPGQTPPPKAATAAEQVLRHASEPDCEPIADWVARERAQHPPPESAMVEQDRPTPPTFAEYVGRMLEAEYGEVRLRPGPWSVHGLAKFFCRMLKYEELHAQLLVEMAKERAHEALDARKVADRG